jgi:hypothetical protein
MERVTLVELPDEALLCRWLGHMWDFKTDASFRRERRRLVEITRTYVCDRGCGCEKDEDLSVPEFDQVRKPRMHYPANRPYLLSVSCTKADYREEFYRRHPNGRIAA